MKNDGAETETAEQPVEIERGVKCCLGTFAKTMMDNEMPAYQEECLRFFEEIVETVPDKKAKIITVRMPRQNGMAYYAKTPARLWRYAGSGKWESI